MSHIKTARDIGVQKAIKEAGYASLEDVYKEAQEIGLLPSQTPQAHGLDGLIAGLVKR
jgi:hypothetical protein